VSRDEAEHKADSEAVEVGARQGRDAAGVNDVREQIQKLLVTGDNRLKQGVAPEKVRETYEQALALARENGLEERITPLVEVRLADLDRLASDS
jgi:hypothetical protein